MMIIPCSAQTLRTSSFRSTEAEHPVGFPPTGTVLFHARNKEERNPDQLLARELRTGRKEVQDSLNDGGLLLSSRPVVEHLPHPNGIETLRVDVDLVHLAAENGEDRDDSRVGGALDEDVVSGSDEDVKSFGEEILEE